MFVFPKWTVKKLHLVCLFTAVSRELAQQLAQSRYSVFVELMNK